MKSSNPTNKSITMREPKGQDIYSQVRLYIDDPLIGVIGVSVPRRLEDRLRVRLLMDAERMGKKIVLIDQYDLAQIVYSVMVRRDISIDQI